MSHADTPVAATAAASSPSAPADSPSAASSAAPAASSSGVSSGSDASGQPVVPASPRTAAPLKSALERLRAAMATNNTPRGNADAAPSTSATVVAPPFSTEAATSPAAPTPSPVVAVATVAAVPQPTSSPAAAVPQQTSAVATPQAAPTISRTSVASPSASQSPEGVRNDSLPAKEVERLASPSAAATPTADSAATSSSTVVAQAPSTSSNTVSFPVVEPGYSQGEAASSVVKPSDIIVSVPIVESNPYMVIANSPLLANDPNFAPVRFVLPSAASVTVNSSPRSTTGGGDGDEDDDDSTIDVAPEAPKAIEIHATRYEKAPPKKKRVPSMGTHARCSLTAVNVWNGLTGFWLFLLIIGAGVGNGHMAGVCGGFALISYVFYLTYAFNQDEWTYVSNVIDIVRFQTFVTGLTHSTNAVTVVVRCYHMAKTWTGGMEKRVSFSESYAFPPPQQSHKWTDESDAISEKSFSTPMLVAFEPQISFASPQEIASLLTFKQAVCDANRHRDTDIEVDDSLTVSGLKEKFVVVPPEAKEQWFLNKYAYMTAACLLMLGPYRFYLGSIAGKATIRLRKKLSFA